MKTPNNLDEAIDYVIAKFSPADLVYVRSPESSPVHVHGTIGLVLRNAWELWEPNPLTFWFVGNHGISNADDVSAVVLAGVWQKARGEVVDVTKIIADIKAHWAKLGIDPITGGKLLTVLATPEEPTRPPGIQRRHWIIDESGFLD